MFVCMTICACVRVPVQFVCVRGFCAFDVHVCVCISMCVHIFFTELVGLTAASATTCGAGTKLFVFM